MARKLQSHAATATSNSTSQNERQKKTSVKTYRICCVRSIDTAHSQISVVVIGCRCFWRDRARAPTPFRYGSPFTLIHAHTRSHWHMHKHMCGGDCRLPELNAAHWIPSAIDSSLPFQLHFISLIWFRTTIFTIMRYRFECCASRNWKQGEKIRYLSYTHISPYERNAQYTVWRTVDSYWLLSLKI